MFHRKRSNEDGGHKCNKGHHDGSSRCISNLNTQKPSSDSNLNDICPKLMNLLDSADNDLNLRIMSTEVKSGVRDDLHPRT